MSTRVTVLIVVLLLLFAARLAVAFRFPASFEVKGVLAPTELERQEGYFPLAQRQDGNAGTFGLVVHPEKDKVIYDALHQMEGYEIKVRVEVK